MKYDSPVVDSYENNYDEAIMFLEIFIVQL